MESKGSRFFIFFTHTFMFNTIPTDPPTQITSVYELFSVKKQWIAKAIVKVDTFNSH